MRAKEFLLEYNQTKTAQVFGHKLIRALKADKGFLTEWLRMQHIQLNSPDMNGISIDPNLFNLLTTGILRQLEIADPTPHKQYTQWLAKVYANEGIKLEDIVSKGADWLQTYQKLKNHKLLTPDINDINKLQFQQLYQIVSDPELNQRLQGAAQAAMPKGTSQTVIDNALVRVIWPKDEAAAKYYGQGTQWCTAANNNNMFERYNKQGPMFIFLPKKPDYPGEKYQIHFASGSFMNEQDEPSDPLYLITEKYGNLKTQLYWVDSSMNKLVLFASDNILLKILEDIRDLASEYINNLEEGLKDNDHYYIKWLREEGYVNKDGGIDWERAPSYLEYDDDARRLVNGLIGSLSPPLPVLRTEANNWAVEEDDSPTLNRMDSILAWTITHNTNSRNETDYYEGLAEWILAKVVVDASGEVSLVKLRPSFPAIQNR